MHQYCVFVCFSIDIMTFLCLYRAFKTFSLKKKSSTLGINKTSESPPPLRKYGNECLYDSNYNTYDTRYRQTVSPGSTTDVAFQRNAPYRATMSGTMNTSAKSYVSVWDSHYLSNDSIDFFFSYFIRTLKVISYLIVMNHIAIQFKMSHMDNDTIIEMIIQLRPYSINAELPRPCLRVVWEVPILLTMIMKIMKIHHQINRIQ